MKSGGQTNGVGAPLGLIFPAAPTGMVSAAVVVPSVPAAYETVNGPASPLMAIVDGGGAGNAASGHCVGGAGAGSPGNVGGGGGSDDTTIEMGGRRFASLEEMARVGADELQGQIKAVQSKMILSALAFAGAVLGSLVLPTPAFLIWPVRSLGILSAFQFFRFVDKRAPLKEYLRYGCNEYPPHDLTTPANVYGWLTRLHTSADYYTQAGTVGMGGGVEAYEGFAGFGQDPGDIHSGLQVRDEASGKAYNFVAMMGRQTIDTYFEMAGRSPRGAEILRILAEHNDLAGDPALISNIDIKWSNSELDEEPGYVKLTTDWETNRGGVIEWLAAKGNRSVVEWVYHNSIIGNERAQKIWAHLSRNQNPQVKRFVADVSKVVFLKKPREIQ